MLVTRRRGNDELELQSKPDRQNWCQSRRNVGGGRHGLVGHRRMRLVGRKEHRGIRGFLGRGFDASMHGGRLRVSLLALGGGVVHRPTPAG